MNKPITVFESLYQQGVSRRSFLKFCAVTASSLGIAASGVKSFAQALGAAKRPSVIWLSFQHCTGCSESLLRSGNPLTDRLTVENLILNFVSLDYHETLQVAAGEQAEAARKAAMVANYGNYILIVDGSLPTAENEWWVAVAGHSGLSILREAVAGAGAIVALGACATFGGIPAASPNPSKAMGVGDLMASGLIPSRTLVNLAGCPPVPEVISGSLAYYVVNGSFPPLDALQRPKVFFGKSVHDCCPRLPHFNAGQFATSFDDEGARQGHCLLLLGCKGPDTMNACNTNKWNMGTSSPVQAGHGCIGCSEPKFWDKPGGIYGTVAGFQVGDGTSCTAPVLSPLPAI